MLILIVTSLRIFSFVPPLLIVSRLEMRKTTSEPAQVSIVFKLEDKRH